MASRARTYRRRTVRFLAGFRKDGGIEGGTIAYEPGGLVIREAVLRGVPIDSAPTRIVKVPEWRPPSR